MRTLHPLLSLALSAGLLGSPAAMAADKKAPRLSPTDVQQLYASSDQGDMSIQVNGAGSFTDANINITADGFSRDLAFRSQLGFSQHVGADAPLTVVAPNKVRSTFAVENLTVDLVQTLQPGPLAGSFMLTQRYEITNPQDTAVKMVMSRYYDGDLSDEFGEWADHGYIPGPGAWNYLVSNPNPSDATYTTYMGIFTTGGVMRRQVVRPCCSWYFVPANEHRLVDGDSNGDHLSDYGSDRALTGQRWLTIDAGSTASFTTRTLFGHSQLPALSSLPGQFPTD